MWCAITHFLAGIMLEICPLVCKGRMGGILPPNALRRDFNDKCIELIEGHYLEVMVDVYYQSC